MSAEREAVTDFIQHQSHRNDQLAIHCAAVHFMSTVTVTGLPFAKQCTKISDDTGSRVLQHNVIPVVAQCIPSDP